MGCGTAGMRTRTRTLQAAVMKRQEHGLHECFKTTANSSQNISTDAMRCLALLPAWLLPSRAPAGCVVCCWCACHLDAKCCVLCWCVQLPAKGKATFKERSAAVGREAALQKQLQEAARDRQVQQLPPAVAPVPVVGQLYVYSAKQ
jgi:hypothetical protein